ncbi:MAG: 7-cyano-7-deazaguanine synthase [Lysobacterales bacterium]|jgi:7-cyano-7-deazaguanine synthase|nr:MAG: 7-cyano-7-deazaguanine synthase [Xanthomonadales bacterium]
MQGKRAVVLLSGGMDSAVALAEARAAGFTCHALSLDYGQRHAAELAAARRVAAAIGAAEHRIVALDLRAFGGSALTSDLPVPESPTTGIPITYVPARNTVLLALALAWAETLGAEDIFIGVNAIDYSGYPDCRPEFIAAFEHLARLATKAGVEGTPFRIHTPLIALSKAEIVRRGLALGVDFALTVSCYQADAEGLACGRCDACRLRAKGFAEAGVPDPTRYRGDPPRLS